MSKHSLSFTDEQTHRHMTLTPCVSHSLSHIHVHIHIHVGVTDFCSFLTKENAVLTAQRGEGENW